MAAELIKVGDRLLTRREWKVLMFDTCTHPQFAFEDCDGEPCAICTECLWIVHEAIAHAIEAAR